MYEIEYESFWQFSILKNRSIKKHYVQILRLNKLHVFMSYKHIEIDGRIN